MPTHLSGDGLHFQVVRRGEIFLPRLFQGFPEIKEALISNRMQAAFIVAPLAIALRAQGVPIKVRIWGIDTAARSWFERRADQDIRQSARPHGRHSEPLFRRAPALFRAMKVWGIKPAEIKMVEMAPPDVAERWRRSHRRLFHGEPFRRRRRWAATAAFCFRPASTGRITCRASGGAAKLDRYVPTWCRSWSTASPVRDCGWTRASRTATMPPSSWADSTTIRSRRCFRWAPPSPGSRDVYARLRRARRISIWFAT